MKLSEVASAASDQLEAQKKRAAYKDDPVAWARDIAGQHLWSSQAEVARSVAANQNVAVKAGHSVGKALSLDTPLPTPTGWTTMGDVQPGDFLLDENANPTRVIATSDTWMEDTYRVTFEDGTYIDAAAQHEWNVLDLTKRTARMKRGVEDWRDYWDSTVIKETQELYREQLTRSGQSRWRIPAARAMKGRYQDFLIDPYVLGAWLGGGSSHGAFMTVHPDDFEILSRFEDAGYRVRELSGEYSWSFADNGVFVATIRDMDLWKNKHIPESYLRSSIPQRQELLRGILDTDGRVSRNGVVTIDLMSEKLARGVAELVRSLGGRATFRLRDATLNGRVVGTRCRMTIKIQDFNPFSLKRKADRWAAVRNGGKSEATKRSIVSIELIETVPTKCVHVDSERHLFLAGEGMIPTHNSYLAALLSCWWVDTRYPDCFLASTAPSTAQIGAIVWREINRMKALIDRRYKEGLIDHTLPGYITSDNVWKTEAGIPIGFGRKPPDQKTDDAFQGLHASQGVLAIGDEAVGLTEEMIDALGNITATKNSRRVLICNPTNPASYVARLFKDRPANWTFHTISVLNSPNFTEERFETPPKVLEALADQSFVDSKREEYGEGSPRWVSRIEGEFAWDVGNTLFKATDLEKAYDTDIVPAEDVRPVLGVDVSRSKTGDTNTIYEFCDGKLRFVDEWNDPNAMNTARKIHQIALEKGVAEVRIDGVGLGGPIADAVREMSSDKYEVIEILGGNPSPDRNRWYNFRAWSFWTFQNRMSKGEIDVTVEDEQLAGELMGIEIKVRSSGIENLLLESKEDMRKRGVKSPNRADAANYAQLDLTAWTENPYNSLPVGSAVAQDRSEMLQFMSDIPMAGAGIPIL